MWRGTGGLLSGAYKGVHGEIQELLSSAGLPPLNPGTRNYSQLAREFLRAKQSVQWRGLSGCGLRLQRTSASRASCYFAEGGRSFGNRTGPRGISAWPDPPRADRFFSRNL